MFSTSTDENFQHDLKISLWKHVKGYINRSSRQLKFWDARECKRIDTVAYGTILCMHVVMRIDHDTTGGDSVVEWLTVPQDVLHDTFGEERKIKAVLIAHVRLWVLAFWKQPRQTGRQAGAILVGVDILMNWWFTTLQEIGLYCDDYHSSSPSHLSRFYRVLFGLMCGGCVERVVIAKGPMCSDWIWIGASRVSDITYSTGCLLVV